MSSSGDASTDAPTGKTVPTRVFAGALALVIFPAALQLLFHPILSDGDVRTLPCYWEDRGGIDGFFVSRLRRI